MCKDNNWATSKEILNMFKLRLQNFLNQLLHVLLYQLVFWYLALAGFVFLTNEQLFVLKFTPDSYLSIFLSIFFFSSFLAVALSLFEGIFSDRLMRIIHVSALNVLRILFLFVLIYIVLVFARFDLHTIEQLYIQKNYQKLQPEYTWLSLRFAVYFLITCFFNHFIIEMIKRLGSGNIFFWLLGRLKKPREEERIFMFVDMKSSTTIAEKLKHEKFSYLVQDVFNDMSVVSRYSGSIYQYLGDGAIVSWKIDKGLRDNNFLKAFFEFSKVIENRGRYYNRKYGFVPKFKAGIHLGKVMVLQVGRIRRDVSYNGDTINTAARIESMCNEYRQNLLISGDLYKQTKNKKEYNFKDIGDIQLKGKRKPVDIYQVKEKPKKRK